MPHKVSAGYARQAGAFDSLERRAKQGDKYTRLVHAWAVWQSAVTAAGPVARQQFEKLYGVQLPKCLPETGAPGEQA